MVQIFDRQRGQIIQEQVFGDTFVRNAYRPGSLLNRWIQHKPFQRLSSKAVGFYYSSSASKALIRPFISKFQVNMDEFLEPTNGYVSFNDFFIRQLKPGVRTFPKEASSLGAPAEGRLSVFPLSGPECVLSIKGKEISLAGLVGSPVLAEQFVGGHAFVFRLCPVDYHRFHFPDTGRAGPSNRLQGELHSVNPLALESVPDVFLRNERQVCLFDSRHFGPLLLMEIGAICVGRITQTYSAGQKVERGQEKGFFSFGGSTTVMLTQKLWVYPDEELLQRTASGMETLVRLGDPIGRAGLTPSP